MIEDMCKFFRDIEANPKKLIIGLKVRDYLALKNHIDGCDSCYNIVQRVDSSNPDKSITFSAN
jgi:hypothetical protein